LVPTDLIEGSISPSDPTTEIPSSSEEKDEVLLLIELDDDIKSRVSKKAASSSSSVSSSAMSFLSLSSSDPLAPTSGSKIEKGNSTYKISATNINYIIAGMKVFQVF
jgi:hypothetical protein